MCQHNHVTGVLFAANDADFSKISALQFQSLTPPGLSGHFVSLSTATEFGVKNDNGVGIGILIGDGVELSYSSALTGYSTLCLAKRSLGSKINPIYTVLDFASSDSNFTTLTPLELNITEETVVIADKNYSRLCAKLSPSGGSSYFPITRVPDWKTRTLTDDPSVRYVQM
jgi:hypothetical protein